MKEKQDETSEEESEDEERARVYRKKKTKKIDEKWYHSQTIFILPQRLKSYFDYGYRKIISDLIARPVLHNTQLS